MLSDKAGIYRIFHLETGKSYIGSSVDVKKRIRRHKKDLKGGNHHNIYLLRSWQKYGEHSFGFKVIDNGPFESDELLRAKEKKLIVDYGDLKGTFNCFYPDEFYMKRKFSHDQILDIINIFLNSDFTHSEIAFLKNASKNTIGKIIRRQIYQDVYIGPELEDLLAKKYKTKSKKTKLSAEDIHTIFLLYADNGSPKDIGSRFGINPPGVINIIRRKEYRSVEIKKELIDRAQSRIFSSRLTSMDLNSLFQDYASGISVVDLCKKYSRNQSTVNKILRRESYIDFDIPEDLANKVREMVKENTDQKKFSNKQIIDIFEQYADTDISYNKLGRQYSVSNASIRQIIHRRNYGDVNVNPEIVHKAQVKAGIIK